jgi:hypothetical protein
MASKYPKLSEQGTAGQRKHVTLAVPQEIEIIRGLDSGKDQSVVVASYSIGSSTVCDIHKQRDPYTETGGPVTVICGIKWKCKGPSQATDVETT